MNSCYIISRTFERPSCSGETFGFADRDAVGARWTARAVKASAPTVTARHHRRQARREQSTPTQPPATLPSTTAIPSPSSSATATATSPLPTTPTASTPKPAMAEKDLQTITSQLQTALQRDPSSAGPLLSRAKLLLLQANALMPSPTTNPAALAAARGILELGALISIKQQDPDSFTRYFHSLSPFYSLPPSALAPAGSQRSKITGLYLLLLLSQGDYAGFHTVLEGLEVEGEKEGRRLDEDAFVQYPVRLEQALMEGAYDRVWGETKGERVPSEEFSVFSQVRLSSTHCTTTSHLQSPPHSPNHSSTSLANHRAAASRSSSTRSAAKSRRAAKRRTHPSPSRTPSRCSSSRARAPSSSLQSSAAGPATAATAASTSPSRSSSSASRSATSSR